MLGIQLLTRFRGHLVGTDNFGNRYYRAPLKTTIDQRCERRWVIYKGLAEPSKVPAEWHGWLHHTQEAPTPIAQVRRFPWEKAHLPNLTGTLYRYLPQALRGNTRPHATGDYTPWKPE